MLGVESAPIRAPDPLINSDLFDADDDESDEEEIVRMKARQKGPTKTHRLILSDDEDEERIPSILDQGDLGSDSEKEESEASDQEADADQMEGRQQDDSDNESDNDKRKEKKKIRRRVQSSDENDSQSDDDEEDKPKRKKNIRRSVGSSDDSDGLSSDDDKPKEKKKIRRHVQSSGESDEGSDSSNDDSDDDGEQKTQKERKKSGRTIGSSDDSSSDEDEEGEIAFQLTPPPQDPEEESNGDKRSMRRKRIGKDELQQIHSESQRIVRESTIQIPYHHPKPLSLDELFNKKPSLTSLKPTGCRVPRIRGKELLNTSTEEESTVKKVHTEEIDDLPDLLTSQVQDNTENKLHCEESSESSSMETTAEAKAGETDKVDTDNAVETEPEATNDTLMQDAEAESSCNTPVVDGKSVTSPVSSDSNTKELSPTKPSNNESPKEEQGLPETSQQSPKEIQTPLFKTPPPTTSTQPDPQSSQARRLQRLQESLNRLKGAQPKLSGGPKITIDLDEGKEPSAEEKGIFKLMKRFVKHTKHVKKTHQKDVQVNIVTKEKGEDGKEDLKHHTFTVELDKKAEELDPTLNVPGAKLCRLKENLQATMRVKREQERKKRQEVFKLDNEEGFGGGEDDEDEAELTEGSDTDEEEERGIGNEDEEEDADYDPGNEFLDGEAESDDDDDDDMDDEEEEEEDTTVKKLKKKSRSLDKVSCPVDSDDEISPSRRKGNTKRPMVVNDVDDGEEEKGITLRLDSTGTEDTDTEISDALQDSGRFNSAQTPRTLSALDQCSKTMEMFDSATNSTVSDFQVPISRVDSSSKKVTWSAASKETDSSKDSMSFVLPAPVRQDSSSNSLDTSFEAMTSLIPAHQPQGGMARSGRTSVDSTKSETFTPFSRHQSTLSSVSAKTVSRHELTLPVEDSQDLFREDSPRLPTIADSQQVTESQSFHFSFEDETQTQFLDENGLLNLKSSSSSKKMKTMFENTQTQNGESQESMDELLGLCSGQFTTTQGVDVSKADKPGPFSQVSQRPGTQANMDELLDLCSGTFTGMEAKSQVSSTRKVEEKDKKEEDDDPLSFHIASDPDGPDSDDDVHNGLSSDEEIAPKKRRRIIQHESDDDEEEEEAEKGGDESDLDSEFEFNRGGFKGKTYGKKLNLANFVEDEAELSGSEADSDENYDAEDEPDDEDLEGIVNEEIGDEDELRSQVNKVHLKTMDDDDARRLRIFKEMYLPDGDLHSDNKGRTRKFRWRHMESQMDMFRPGSDGEEDEEDAQDQDTQWRLTRYQREQWLKENEEKTSAVTPDSVTPSLDESSQFAKCLRAASIKKPQVETPTQEVEEKEPKKENKIGTPKPLKIMSKRGSFLSRSKNDLAKMASMLKPVTNPQGPRSTRNFVFQSAEASIGGEDSVVEPPKVKRSVSASGPSTTPSGPKPKRPRLDRSQSQFTSNSVFRHF
ncbi:claspin-like [Lytechinus pictus]|uniref:claspin-like n=1 Tax=Lytechinus pictus TaxID=7653 RepID=UPI0030B9C712